MTKIQETFDNAEIGRRVRQLRKQHSMKQDQLCELLQLSRGQISNLETNKRRWAINQIYAVADFFGVSIEALGVPSTKVEIPDLLARAKTIFENENVPLEDKQELSEEIYAMYLEIKNKIKDK